jgi:ketosteroid isomerase-like protein
MSQENVELVRSLFAAFSARDLKAASRVLHPEVEIRPSIVGGPEGVTYRGVDGNATFWAEIDSAWAEFTIDPKEFRDLGDQVLVLGNAFARGRESGVAVEQQGAWLAQVRDGQIVRFRSFSDQREALEAAELRE